MSLIFMAAVTICTDIGSASELMDELEAKYGKYVMAEGNLRFAPEYKAVVNRIVFEEKKLPDFGVEIDHVSYEDGCKVYFGDGSFVICRFSGTEPLLRIFAESSTRDTAEKYIRDFRELLNI